MSCVDAIGDRTSYSYDGDNELTQMADPAGGTTSFSYDADGNLLQIQDARADRTTMTYDPLGRMLTRTDGLNRTASYSYDHDGNLVLATDRRGITTAYHYNGLDQRTFAGYGASDSAGDSPYQDSVDYTYDAGGELLQAVDASAGTFGYGYDGLGRTTSTTTPDGSVAYGYDDASRLTSVTANGTLTSYGYDAANWLASVTQGSQTVSVGYDSDGRRSTLTLPNGVVQTDTYDDASRLTDLQYGLGSTSVGDLHYAFDPAGHRIAAWGSLARTTIPAPIGSASYDTANERTSRDGQTLLYDAFSAGVLDGAFWGAPSAMLGIPHACWAGTLHGAGQLVGAVAPGARISFGISAVLGAERGLIGSALASAAGGAAAGAYTAMGTGRNPAQGAVIGLSGGAGGALGNLGDLGGTGAAAAATAGGATIDTTVDMGSALATDAGSTSGVKDGC